MSSRWLTVALLVGIGVLTWRVGMMLDRPDLVWGLVLGALAGLPAALLVLFVARRGGEL